ncbi:hypothetical protein Sviol_50670 [Streptomyces violascens]|uniref:Uncharacterized protein n=1 Tax=Streptomyces violascens TaxID=67381 RepID=A0ABQ3QTN9_9ACTN|nr:hypothetical protein Sviol_50670 [Streptomyces violascens]
MRDLRHEGDDGVDRGVHPLDLPQVRLQDLTCGDLAGHHQFYELTSGLEDEILIRHGAATSRTSGERRSVSAPRRHGEPLQGRPTVVTAGLAESMTLPPERIMRSEELPEVATNVGNLSRNAVGRYRHAPFQTTPSQRTRR